MKERMVEQFKQLFGPEGDIRAYFAPGRVNLIGEHTDYNGGHVFPCALTLGTYAIARKREDDRLRLYSANFESLGVIESSLNDLVPSEAAGWTNYPKGVMWTFEKRGYKLTNGLDILIYGNIPNGSGLSSSASLEVLTGVLLKDMFAFDDLTMVEIAQIGQYSENNFNGCNCGIMDQFASAMGKKDNAIFLDTNTLQYEYAPVVLEDAKIVIVNSKVKHSLVDSAYNDRRNECEIHQNINLFTRYLIIISKRYMRCIHQLSKCLNIICFERFYRLDRSSVLIHRMLCSFLSDLRLDCIFMRLKFLLCQITKRLDTQHFLQFS